MLCLNSQSQWVSPLALKPASIQLDHQIICPAFLPQPQRACSNSSELSDDQRHRQWPWRLFPFTSDLGTVGCLLNKPGLGILGWAIATPYYLYAILKQPNAHQRKDEMLYQSTANGIFPFVAAKTGLKSGEKLYQLINKNSLKVPRVFLKENHLKLLSALFGLAVLTPLAGDPISQRICHKYQERTLNVIG